MEMQFELCLSTDELNLVYNTILNGSFRGEQAPRVAILLGKIAEAAEKPTYAHTTALDANAGTEDGREDGS